MNNRKRPSAQSLSPENRRRVNIAGAAWARELLSPKLFRRRHAAGSGRTGARTGSQPAWSRGSAWLRETREAGGGSDQGEGFKRRIAQIILS